MSSILRYKLRKETKRIILHDSHTTPETNTVGEVTRWDALMRDGALQMGLLDTGYHFIIDRNGDLILGREHSRIGTHTPGHNMDSLGICLIGGREENREGGIDNFTLKQRMTLFSTIFKMNGVYGELELKGHSEVQKYRNRALPDCPPIEMDDLRQDYLLYAHERRMSDEQREDTRADPDPGIQAAE